jgi:hypothetical protein
VSPESLLVLGLLASAAAIGLSPYSALAAVGLAASLGFAPLPGSLVGLAAPAVWGTLVLFAALDGLISRYRVPDLVWNAFHTVAKPLAAVLYAAAGLVGGPPNSQWALAGASLLIALLVHLSVLSVRTAARTAGPISWSRGLTLLRLFVAAALGVLALSAPPFAFSLAAVLVLALLPAWPRIWGAASLTLRSVTTLLSRPDRLHRWDPAATRLSGEAHRVVEQELGAPLGSARSAPVTLARLGPHWVYRRGRLVIAAHRPAVFLHRRRFRLCTVSLTPGPARADNAALIETVDIDAGVPYALCLGPEAPPGPAILAELESAGAWPGPAEHPRQAGV